jgi:hypothetical protein
MRLWWGGLIQTPAGFILPNSTGINSNGTLKSLLLAVLHLQLIIMKKVTMNSITT